MGFLRFFIGVAAIALGLPGFGEAPAFAQRLGGQALIIGDSHLVGALGDPLRDELQKKGVASSSYALSNSNPVHWYNSQAPRPIPGGHATRYPGFSEVRYVGTKQFPTYSELVKRHDPDVFIFAFGDNFAGYGSADPEKVQPSSAEGREAFARSRSETPVEQVRKMIAAAKLSPRFRKERCFWITPPPKRKGFGDKRLAELAGWIREGLGDDCRLIETTKLPGMKSAELKYIDDGMHLDHPSGPPWAEGILAEMQKASLPPAPSLVPPAAAAPKGTPFPRPRTTDPRTAPSTPAPFFPSQNGG